MADMISTYACNPWHYVEPGPAEQLPTIVNAVIEISAGSKAKYELHKETGMLKLDRILFSSVHYPTNYGFIPKTYCDDHDPLDILVFCSEAIEPMALVEAKVVGVMKMIDGDEKDDKIIAVALRDQQTNHINRLSDLPPHYLKMVKNFFEDYKKLEGKTVTVDKFEEKEEAERTVVEAIQYYKEHFGLVSEKVSSLNSVIKLKSKK